MCWNRRSFKWITVTLYWFQKLPKSTKWSGASNKIYSMHPIQHMYGWPHWLGVRLQMSDGCFWEFNTHWRQLLKYIYFSRIYLSDRSSIRFSVRFAYREKPEHLVWDNELIWRLRNPVHLIKDFLTTKYSKY